MAKASEGGAASGRQAGPDPASLDFLDSAALAALLGRPDGTPGDDDLSFFLIPQRGQGLPTDLASWRIDQQLLGNGDQGGWDWGSLMATERLEGFAFRDDLMPLDPLFLEGLHNLMAEGSDRLGVLMTSDRLDSWALFIMVPPTEPETGMVFTFG